MTTAYTNLLGLALPVQGELDGAWGDVVNNAITTLLEDAVAGTTELSSDADATLTSTAGADSEARAAILLWSAGGTTTRTITAPASSKVYVVINATTGSQSIQLVGAGPTTGITVVAGEKCIAAWDGSDFVKVSSSVPDGVTSVAGTGSVHGLTLSGTVTSTGTLTLGGSLSAINLTSEVTGTLPVASGGTGATSVTGLVKGNGTSAFTAATSGTDYAPATSGSSILYGNGSGGFSNVTIGSNLTFSGGTLTATDTNTTPGTSTSILAGDGANGFADVTVGSGLTFSGGTLSTDGTAGLGTVTSVGVSVPTFLSVADSPVTSSGTIAISYSGTALPVANGGTGAVTLTGIVKGNGTGAFTAATSGTDYAPATSGSSILYGNGSGGFSDVTVGTGLSFTGGTLTATAAGTGTSTSILAGDGNAGFSDVTIGSGLSFSAGTLTATGSGGTVTSVGLSVPAFLSVTGSPVTTSGDLTINYSGTALPVANGGTGATSLTGLVVGNGTGAFTTTTAPSGSLVGTTDTQTLTGKTISATGNTISGLPATSFAYTNGSGVLDGTGSQKAIPAGDVVGTSDTQTLSNKTMLDNYETVYALSGTAIDPANGSIQTKTFSANTTLTDSLSSGQSLVLMLTGGSSYTITWPTMTWVSSAGNVEPTLTANDVVILWKVGTTLYGGHAGSYA